MIKGQRLLRATAAYNKKLRATVHPWVDAHHTWIGFIYVFDDDRTPHLLYFVPVEDDTMHCHIHITEVDFVPGMGLRLLTSPDPATDERYTID